MHIQYTYIFPPQTIYIIVSPFLFLYFIHMADWFALRNVIAVHNDECNIIINQPMIPRMLFADIFLIYFSDMTTKQ